MIKLLSRLAPARMTIHPLPAVKTMSADEKDTKDAPSVKGYPADDKGTRAHKHIQINAAFLDVADLDPELLNENGKERVIETAHDFSTRLISLEDDTTIQVHTVRMWSIGLGLTCFGAVLGQIFTFRPQEFRVSALFLQIIAYILGTGWHKVFPKADKGRFWAVLNPGPFNIKEHVCITVMASTASGGALAISTFAAEKLYYNINLNYGIAIFTLVASQFFGYGLGGLYRSIVVYPTFAVWPSLIPSISLLEALHRDQDLRSQKRRFKLFWIVFCAIFVWEWFPEIIAPTLTGISVFCLANRNNPDFTRVFGGTNGNEGLGLFSICFDWLQITSTPLYQPWATTVSQGVGTIFCIVIAIGGYYRNVWNAKNYPFMGQTLFYENGTRYAQKLILDSNFNLNKTALAEQGLPSYSWTNAVYYFGLNLSIGASFTHVFLWYRKDLIAAWRQWRNGVNTDPHYQKMQAYPECPMWIYFCTMIGALIIALATLYTGHSGMPWYSLLIGSLFACVELPSEPRFAFKVESRLAACSLTEFLLGTVLCVMLSITGFGTSGSNLCQMLGAAIVPGNARASLYFRLYSSNSVAQGSTMVKDLKLAQVSSLDVAIMSKRQD
ncbi:BQ2448_2405 [Microbotryum intermedium]|uniref:BQ2448_2405 protein n=1 Tax=Microbotryum intermedium TaxID=269621 RepID=A0A238F856_9BASI|nr:BQ2448_2405 [Microbotryum intermedium]